MKGRKRIYKPGDLKLGGRIELKGPAKDFAHQYIWRFRQEHPDKEFQRVEEKGKVFIERVPNF